MSEFQKDAEDSAKELPVRISRLSDAALLSIALRNEQQQFEAERGRLYAV